MCYFSSTLLTLAATCIHHVVKAVADTAHGTVADTRADTWADTAPETVVVRPYGVHQNSHGVRAPMVATGRVQGGVRKGVCNKCGRSRFLKPGTILCMRCGMEKAPQVELTTVQVSAPFPALLQTVFSRPHTRRTHMSHSRCVIPCRSGFQPRMTRRTAARCAGPSLCEP